MLYNMPMPPIYRICFRRILMILQQYNIPRVQTQFHQNNERGTTTTTTSTTSWNWCTKNGIDIHFTLEGTKCQLEKLLKEDKIIPAFNLRNNGKMVRISRVLNLKARNDAYFTPSVETTPIENPLYQGTTFEYEDLTDFLPLSSKML